MHKRRLPIADPCSEDWDEMRRDGAGRRCQRCTTTVIDLSTLTEREVERLMARAQEGLCVRYTFDDDGVVQLRSPPPRRGIRELAIGLGLASLVSGAAPAFADASVTPLGGAAATHQPAPATTQTARATAPPAQTTDKPADHHVRKPTPMPRHAVMGKMPLPRDPDKF